MPSGLATWSEAFGDYERRTKDGLQRQHTVGVVAGVDKTMPAGSGELRLGILGGYAETIQRSNTAETRRDGTFDVEVRENGDPSNLHQFSFTFPEMDELERTVTTDLRRRFQVVNGGLTGSYSLGRFFIDGVARIEHSDITQRGSLGDPRGELTRNFRQARNGPAYYADGSLITTPQRAPTTPGNLGDLGCVQVDGLTAHDPGDPDATNGVRSGQISAYLGQVGAFGPSTVPLNGDTSSLGFILANAMGITYELGNGFLFEPIVGYRYIYTDYSRSAAALGIQDGRALRLEAGGKISHINVSRYGSVWINSIGLYAYSDVIAKGFVVAADGSSSGSDEGELRGRAVLQSQLQMPNGVSYYGEVNGRFGDQYWGVGGKLGMRYEW